MKPTEPDIAWCIEHRDWINGLLEKRGGWQDGDWRAYPGITLRYRLCLVVAPALRPMTEPVVWLPSVGDVLAMLFDRGVRPWLMAKRTGEWKVAAFTDGDPKLLDGYTNVPHPTPLIALLELMKVVEGKG